MSYSTQHFNMINPVFGINFPRLDETVRFVKLLEIILRTYTYISLAMKPVERLNADCQQLPAYSCLPRGREGYDTPDRRFPVGRCGNIPAAPFPSTPSHDDKRNLYCPYRGTHSSAQQRKPHCVTEEWRTIPPLL